jgi:hypothetical protein
MSKKMTVNQSQAARLAVNARSHPKDEIPALGGLAAKWCR